MSNSEPNTLEVVVHELVLALEPLGRAAEEGPEGFLTLAAAAGIDLEAQLAAVEDVQSILNTISPVYATLETVIETGSVPSDQFDDVVVAIKGTIAALEDLKTLSFTPDADLAPQEVVERLLDHLTVRYFRLYHPSVFSVLEIIGVIDTETPKSEPPRVEFEAFEQLLASPDELAERSFDWGTDALDWEELLEWLRRLLLGMGISSRMEPPQPGELEQLGYDLPSVAEVEAGTAAPTVPPVVLRIPLLDAGEGDDYVEAGLKVIPLAPSSSNPTAGLVIVAYGVGAIDEDIELDDAWVFTFDAAGTVSGGFGVVVRPLEFAVRSTEEGQANPQIANAWATAAITRQAKPDERTLLLGWPDGPRIEVGSVGLRLHFEASPEEVDFSVAAPIDWHLELQPPPEDGFLQSFLPSEGVSADVATSVGVSPKTGLQLEGQPGFEVDLVSHERVGPIGVDEVSLHIDFDEAGALRATVAGSISGELGPLSVVVGGLGYETTVGFVGAGGNLGPLDLDGDVVPPSRIGLSIDTGAVVGGGYVDFDPDNHRYAGILELAIAEKIEITAVGLLTTRLPNGNDGFSLLIILTGEFPPIQLGYGVTLNGLGGLFGLNRTANVPVLQEGVRTGEIKRILFPEDPVRNATQLISDLETAFPPTNGRFLFGPLAQLGWGTPSLIIADIGVVLELPSPIRLLILGRLSAIFPDERAKLLTLNMDVLGVIDFAEKRASVDASLYDSRLVTYGLEGDMAMRANWGDDPGFLLSVGGFNPRYDPPPELPELKRVSVSLTSVSNPRLRMEGYFAVTTNTVQVGARLDLYASAAGFSVSGELGFDTLFEFDPFRFIADLYARVALKGGPFEISVGLEVTLSGPSPFRAKGVAHYEFLFIEGSVRFDKTFGAEPAAQPLPSVEILPQLLSALENPGNWDAQLPTIGGAVVRLREAEYPGTVAVHPLGTVTVRQQVVPLSTQIDKAGGARPVDGSRFDIRKAEVSRPSSNDLPTETLPTDGEGVLEHFAPDQYLDLSSEERLTEPGFRKYPAGAHIGPTGVDFPARTTGFSIGGVTTTRTLEYEQKVIDKRVSRTKRNPVEATLVALPEETAIALTPLTAAGIGAFIAGRPGRIVGPDQRIRVKEPTYVLASTETLNVEAAYLAGDAVVGVRLDEAKARLRADVGPKAGGYHVVPAYEVKR